MCADGYYEEPGKALYITKLLIYECSYKCEIQSDKCLTCPLNSLRMFDPINSCICPGEY